MVDDGGDVLCLDGGVEVWMLGFKINCWDFKGCGRQPEGDNTEELGVCPAAKDPRLDGVHGGKNAGRACWVLVGTLCQGEVQGTFAQKSKNCFKCDFYQSVQQGEGKSFCSSANLMARLRAP